MSSVDALITDANQRVALEVVRCLGRRNLRLCLVETAGGGWPLSFASRYAHNRVRVPAYNSPEFVDLCERARVVYPVSTNTIAAMYRLPRSIREKCLLPPEERFRQMNNKYRVVQRARELGIGYPRTIRVVPGERAGPGLARMTYPLVVKLIDDEGLFLDPDQRYVIVHEEQQLTEALSGFARFGKPVLVQEYIPGHGAGFSALYGPGGRYVTGIGHRRLRELPPDGGPSTYCESLGDSELRRQARRLLDGVDWAGPAMVEFRLDDRDGLYKIMEVNPRYWGSMPLARAAGVNLPYIHYCLRLGRSYGDLNLRVHLGVRLKFWFTDLLSWFSTWIRGPEKLRELTRYLRDETGGAVHSGLWERSDPGPGLWYLVKKLGKRLRIDPFGERGTLK